MSTPYRSAFNVSRGISNPAQPVSQPIRGRNNPALPVSQPAEQPASNGESTCCCCTCCCIIFALIFGFFFALGMLFYASDLQSTPINFYITGASLTQFDIDPTSNALQYNLALNLTFRNPNRARGMHYEKIAITTLYQGHVFASTALEQHFYLGYNNITNVNNIVLDGNTPIFLGNEAVTDYTQDSKLDRYVIHLVINLRTRLEKVPIFRNMVLKNDYYCSLVLPVSVDRRTSSYATSCYFNY